MNTDDDLDELTLLLRSADPARTPLAAPPTPAALAALEGIVGHPRGNARPRNSASRQLRPAGLVASVFSVMAVAVVALLPIGLSSSPAVAYGLPPLTYDDDAFVRSTDEVAQEVLTLLANDGTAEEPAFDSQHQAFDSQHQTSLWWDIEIIDGKPPAQLPSIHTSIGEYEWRADGSGILTVTAGPAMSVDGTDASPARTDGVEPGTLLWETVYEAGEYAPIFETAVNRTQSPEEILRLLGLDPTFAAGDMAIALQDALGQRNLKSPEQAIVFNVLRELDGFSYLGQTTDRFGRAAIAFEASTPRFPHRREIVTMSASTGRFLAIEEVTVGDDPTVDVPPGTVISFRAWPNEI